LGSKKFKTSVAQTRDSVRKAEEIANRLAYFLQNEWVADTQTVTKLSQFASSFGKETSFAFDVDLTKVNWKSYSMNLAYGIKNYILKEEAAMPSMGYNDVVNRMVRMRGADLLPGSTQGQPAQVRSREEMTKLILANSTVKHEIAALVK
jgi:hypothetical protein